MNTQVADPLLGTLVDGRYRIRGRVARGGMATVYTAVDERLERTVAVKMIQAGQARDGAARASHQLSVDRFTDEAKTIARLTHPNVVAVYDQGTHHGMPYLVMEYVRGRTLRDILVERRRLGPTEALAILEQILSALAAAHRAGLVHRDVKPENVLIAEAPSGGSTNLVDSVVKVADFGLARAVEASAEEPDAGHLMATVAYVSPELVAEGSCDPRSDVYSAGIVLFEMLTGRVPYDGERPVDVAWQHVDRDVPAPSRFATGLPPAIDELVLHATRRDPGARPTDAGALLTEVQAARDGVQTISSSATQRLRPVEQPTIVVSQITPNDRPSWAKLPSPGPATSARGSSRRRPVPKTLPQRIAAWHRDATSDQRGRMIFTACVVVFCLLILTGGWWLGFGRYEATPTLINQSRAQAEAVAAAAGLRLEFQQAFSDNVPKDVVLAQDPPAGDRILKGGTITLTISNGPEVYLVPDVIGKQFADAEYDLKAAPLNLVPKKVAERFDDVAPAGVVIDSKPKPGEQVAKNGVVELTVSKGRAPLTVPVVVGKNVNEALAILRGMKLDVNWSYTKSERPRDEVVEQTPPSGSGVEAGAKITLLVSDNPNGIPMPVVTGLSCKDAEKQLKELGLQVQVDANPFEHELGKVERQNPEPNQPVQANQQVYIKCKIG